MKSDKVLSIVVPLLLALAPVCNGGEEAAEPLLRELPAGVLVKSSTAVAAEQRRAIGAKLGGEIARLTNSVLLVHGRAIQVNVIAAADEAGAAAAHAALLTRIFHES